MTGGGFRPTFRSPLSEKSVLEEGVFKRILSQCRCSSAPPSRSLTAIPRNILRLARPESFGVASRGGKLVAAGAQQRSPSHGPSRQNRRLSRPLFRQAFAAANACRKSGRLKRLFCRLGPWLGERCCAPAATNFPPREATPKLSGRASRRILRGIAVKLREGGALEQRH